MNEVISIIVSFVAPFLLQLLKKVGLSGTPMLWVVYGVSVLLSFAINFLTGTLDFTNVSVSVGIILAMSQTIHQMLIKPNTE